MSNQPAALGLTGRISAASARHPWRTIAIWVVLTLALVASSRVLGGVFTTDISFTDRPESQASRELLKTWQGEPFF